MLLQHGSFEKVEAVVKKWHETRDKLQRRAGWVTKQWLIDNRSWDKTLDRIRASMCAVLVYSRAIAGDDVKDHVRQRVRMGACSWKTTGE